MALVNYGVLTRTVAEGGQIFPSAVPAWPPSAPGTERTAVAHPAPQPQPAQPATPSSQPSIPEAFALKSAGLDGLKLLEAPQPAAADTNNLPPARWLFGQYNKFLATKATCRALLNLLFESPAGIAVAEASNKISYAACTLGDYLQRLDQRLQSRREDAFAAAFPSSATANGGGESRLRFGNQFVAHMRQDRLGGFPAALRLVALDAAKEPRLSLTRAGAQFASLENPVLDGATNPPARKLSEAEVEFLLNHIIHTVPEEASAYAAILGAIQSGANTPDTMDEFLRQRFNLQTEEAITKTFLTTQRTGAISRMADLGLIAREKQGLRVTYLLTKPGREFRSQIKS